MSGIPPTNQASADLIKSVIEGSLLIAEQQITIRLQDLRIEAYEQMRKDVYVELHSIGAPLNDNSLAFNVKQREVLRRIAKYVDFPFEREDFEAL